MIRTFRRLWEFSSRRHGSLKMALLASFLRCSFAVTQLVALSEAILVLLGDLDGKTAVIHITVLAVICMVGNFASQYFEQIKSMETSFYMIGDKRVESGNHLRKVPLGFFNNTSCGSITATLTTTLGNLESGGIVSLISIISGIFTSVAFFFFMLYFDWRMGILTGLGMAAYLFIVNWQMKVSARNAPALQKAQSSLAESALTFLMGIKVTKAFSYQAGDEKLKKAVAGSSDANVALTDRSMPSQMAATLTIAIGESVLLLTAVFLYFKVGDISAARAIVMMIFSFMAYASLNQAGSILSMIGLLDTGLAEVEKIEKTEQLVERKPEETAASSEIVFDHVSFSYGDREVLHDISTRIAPQSLTAIIGPSGSGKTTMCQLIPRFRDVSDGKITIGGADIRNMTSEKLMEKISMVFQNVYLFEDTIFNNIRFGRPDATLEEVRTAARKAQCDDFIMALPEGYDTMVKEGGSSLSGGEKQRISIARAILKDSPIIIMDEATSALDAENEHEILAAIDELTRNKTVIMIAHRLQSVRRADKIIAIREGTIVQEGTHKELAAQKGLYADFIAAREEAGGWRLTNGKSTCNC